MLSTIEISLVFFAIFVCLLLTATLWADRRRTVLHRELAIRDERFRAFFDNSPVGLAILDRGLAYQVCNATRTAMEGKLTDQLHGQSVLDCPPPFSRVAADAIHEALINGRTNLGLQIDHCGPDGRRFWHASWFPLFDGSKKSPIGVGEIILDVTEQRRAKLALEESEKAYRNLAGRREDERESGYRRLAREFHDELGQSLTSARLKIQAISEGLDNQPLKDDLHQIEAIIRDAYVGAKSIVAELRPPILNLGLTAAIEWLADRSFGSTKVQYTISTSGESAQMDEQLKTTIFRIVQESLTNISKHADAHNVHVSLRSEPDRIQVTVSDDGCGFDVTRIDQSIHYGITGIRERASAIGATVDIDTQPGEGTHLILVVPRTIP